MNFYFTSSEPGAVYKVSRSAAALSKLFESESKAHELSYLCEGNPLVLEKKCYPIGVINTTDLLGYAYKYIKLWEDNVSGANYLKPYPITTYDITQILHTADIALIEEYLGEHVRRTPDNQLTRVYIKSLSILLMQVDEFLGLESFANKIYAYVSVLIYQKSVSDLAEFQKVNLYS
jgi:hypothetical protein